MKLKEAIAQLFQWLIPPMFIWIFLQEPNNLDSTQYFPKALHKWMYFKGAEWVKWLIQHSKDMPQQYLHMDKLVQVKLILWWVRKVNLLVMHGHLIKMMDCFYKVVDICGNKWPKEQKSFMSKQVFWKFTMNNFVIYLTLKVESYMLVGIAKMDFL